MPSISLVVSTTEPSVSRILVADISTVTSLAGSSISFWISATALRGTITPGMPAEPSGAAISTRARRWPSVDTTRSTVSPSRSIVWRYTPLR